MSGVEGDSGLLETVKSDGRRSWIKTATPALLILLCVASGAVAQTFWNHEIITTLDRARSLGGLGWMLMYLLAVIVAAVGVLPASVIGIAAGAVYGIGLGFTLAASGIMTGALIGFFAARRRRNKGDARAPWSRRRKVDTESHAGALTKIATAVEHGGWKIVCMIRLSPVMPFSLISYCMGMTNIALLPYMAGTLAALPSLLLYVMAGQQGTDHGFTAMSAIELTIGIGATIGLSVWAKRQIR